MGRCVRDEGAEERKKRNKEGMRRKPAHTGGEIKLEIGIFPAKFERNTDVPLQVLCIRDASSIIDV